jgi:hypothetical protein
MPFPQQNPPTHECLRCSLIFGRAGEYFHAYRTLAPFSLAPTFSTTTTLAFTILHLKSYGYLLLFLEDYEPNQDLELSIDSFKLTFQRMPHLLASGPFGMVLEHL